MESPDQEVVTAVLRVLPIAHADRSELTSSDAEVDFARLIELTRMSVTPGAWTKKEGPGTDLPQQRHDEHCDPPDAHEKNSKAVQRVTKGT